MASTVKEITTQQAKDAWAGFNGGLWQSEINVRDCNIK
jgi:hypothetical protein